MFTSRIVEPNGDINFDGILGDFVKTNREINRVKKYGIEEKRLFNDSLYFREDNQTEERRRAFKKLQCLYEYLGFATYHNIQEKAIYVRTKSCYSWVNDWIESQYQYPFQEPTI